MVPRKRYRYTFEVVFHTEEHKTQFSECVDRAKQKVEDRQGGKKLSNFEFLDSLLSVAESEGDSGLTPQPPSSVRLLNRRSAILDVACN